MQSLGCSTRRTERRNRNVHTVHEDFEYRATQQCAHYPMDDLEAMEFLLDKIKSTKNNADFFDSMRRG